MVDFQFLYNKFWKSWTILAPRRSKRPNEIKDVITVCPFCVGQEGLEKELYRVGGEKGDQNWQVRVIPNKFPFAPIHELVIHSPDHHKNFGELPEDQVQLIFETYRERFNEHREKGQVYIFHNRGEQAGESLPHPHTQLTVIDRSVTLQTPQLYQGDASIVDESFETQFFQLFCPYDSFWPDEVWIAPLRREEVFGDISDDEISDLSKLMKRLIEIMDLRHGHEFPYNFYIYPGRDWYIRFIPREKRLGGFELGTGIMVNTQDPRETFAFIREHLLNPDPEKIKRENTSDYSHHV